MREQDHEISQEGAPLDEAEHQRKLLNLVRSDKNAIVRASAGTGKTYSLVTRIVCMLAGLHKAGEPVPPGNICAITFTEKAAAEMQSRVRERVLSLVESPEGDALINALAEDAGREPPPASHWRRVHRDLGGMVISTFHGFCARILREFPIEAGVEPGFKLADELIASSLLMESVESVVFARLAASEPTCLRLLHMLALNDSVHGAGLVRIVAEVLSSLREDGRDARWLSREYTRPDPAATTQKRQASLKTLAKQKILLIRIWKRIDRRILAQGKSADKIFLRDLDNFARSADALEKKIHALSPEEWINYIPDIMSYTCPLRRQGRASKGMQRNVRALLDTFPTFQEGFVEELLADLAEHLRADFIELLVAVDREYRRRKRTQGLLDFTDLLLGARHVLRSHRSVRRSLKQRFKMLLVDEFQDTNPTQLDLVMMLLEDLEKEVEVQNGADILQTITVAPDRLFLVGDPKQSIYNFRGADVSVFRHVERTLVMEQETAHTHYLQCNRRSLKGLINFGNRWFAKVLGTSGDREPDFVVRFTDGDKLDAWRQEPHQAPPVEYLALPETSRADEEASAVARWIAGYIHGEGKYAVYSEKDERRYGDIAILLRTFRNLQTFQDALQRLQIPYYVVKGRGFFGCAEIRDLHMALRLMLDPEDTLALVGVARSPLFLLSDDGLAWLQRLAYGRAARGLTLARVKEVSTRLPEDMDPMDRQAILNLVNLYERIAPEADRLGPRAALVSLLEMTSLKEKLAGTFRGRQKIGNVEKLVDMADEYERTTFGHLPGFVRKLHLLINKEPREAEGQVVEEHANVVRIMTIHQSKGLEFPVVMVPEVHTITGKRVNGDPVQYDRKHGLQVRLRVRHMGRVLTDLETDGYEKLRRVVKEREDAEERRLIYVAVTRARDFLWLSGRGYALTSAGSRTKISYDNPLTSLQDMVAEGDLILKPLCKERTFEDLFDPEALKEGQKEKEEDPAPSLPPMRTSLWTEAIQRAFPSEGVLCGDISALGEGPTIGVTHLADFARCPRRYFFWHVVGLRDVDGSPGEHGETHLASRLLERGEAAHEVLEHLDFVRYRASNETERTRMLQALLVLQGAQIEAEEQAIVAQGLCSFLGNENTLEALAHAQELNLLEREKPFLLRVTDAEEVQVFLQGQIDLLIHREGQAPLILDYKFSKRSSRGAEAHRFQLMVYALATRAFGQAKHETWAGGVAFLHSDEKPDWVQGSSVELEKFGAELPGVAQRLVASRRSSQWPQITPDGAPREAKRCFAEGCGFYHRCFPETGENFERRMQ